MQVSDNLRDAKVASDALDAQLQQTNARRFRRYRGIAHYASQRATDRDTDALVDVVQRLRQLTTAAAASPDSNDPLRRIQKRVMMTGAETHLEEHAQSEQFRSVPRGPHWDAVYTYSREPFVNPITFPRGAVKTQFMSTLVGITAGTAATLAVVATLNFVPALAPLTSWLVAFFGGKVPSDVGRFAQILAGQNLYIKVFAFAYRISQTVYERPGDLKALARQTLKMTLATSLDMGQAYILRGVAMLDNIPLPFLTTYVHGKTVGLLSTTQQVLLERPKPETLAKTALQQEARRRWEHVQWIRSLPTRTQPKENEAETDSRLMRALYRGKSASSSFVKRHWGKMVALGVVSGLVHYQAYDRWAWNAAKGAAQLGWQALQAYLATKGGIETVLMEHVVYPGITSAFVYFPFRYISNWLADTTVRWLQASRFDFDLFELPVLNYGATVLGKAGEFFLEREINVSLRMSHVLGDLMQVNSLHDLTVRFERNLPGWSRFLKRISTRANLEAVVRHSKRAFYGILSGRSLQNAERAKKNEAPLPPLSWSAVVKEIFGVVQTQIYALHAGDVVLDRRGNVLGLVSAVSKTEAAMTVRALPSEGLETLPKRDAFDTNSRFITAVSSWLETNGETKAVAMRASEPWFRNTMLYLSQRVDGKETADDRTFLSPQLMFAPLADALVAETDETRSREALMDAFDANLMRLSYEDRTEYTQKFEAIVAMLNEIHTNQADVRQRLQQDMRNLQKYDANMIQINTLAATVKKTADRWWLKEMDYNMMAFKKLVETLPKPPKVSLKPEDLADVYSAYDSFQMLLGRVEKETHGVRQRNGIARELLPQLQTYLTRYQALKPKMDALKRGREEEMARLLAEMEQERASVQLKLRNTFDEMAEKANNKPMSSLVAMVFDRAARFKVKRPSQDKKSVRDAATRVPVPVGSELPAPQVTGSASPMVRGTSEASFSAPEQVEGTATMHEQAVGKAEAQRRESVLQRTGEVFGALATLAQQLNATRLSQILRMAETFMLSSLLKYAGNANGPAPLPSADLIDELDATHKRLQGLRNQMDEKKITAPPLSACVAMLTKTGDAFREDVFSLEEGVRDAQFNACFFESFAPRILRSMLDTCDKMSWFAGGAMGKVASGVLCGALSVGLPALATRLYDSSIRACNDDTDKENYQCAFRKFLATLLCTLHGKSLKEVGVGLLGANSKLVRPLTGAVGHALFSNSTRACAGSAIGSKGEVFSKFSMQDVRNIVVGQTAGAVKKRVLKAKLTETRKTTEEELTDVEREDVEDAIKDIAQEDFEASASKTDGLMKNWMQNGLGWLGSMDKLIVGEDAQAEIAQTLIFGGRQTSHLRVAWEDFKTRFANHNRNHAERAVSLTQVFTSEMVHLTSMVTSLMPQPVTPQATLQDVFTGPPPPPPDSEAITVQVDFKTLLQSWQTDSMIHVRKADVKVDVVNKWLEADEKSGLLRMPVRMVGRTLQPFATDAYLDAKARGEVDGFVLLKPSRVEDMKALRSRLRSITEHNTGIPMRALGARTDVGLAHLYRVAVMSADDQAKLGLQLVTAPVAPDQPSDLLSVPYYRIRDEYSYSDGVAGTLAEAKTWTTETAVPAIQQAGGFIKRQLEAKIEAVKREPLREIAKAVLLPGRVVEGVLQAAPGVYRTAKGVVRPVASLVGAASKRAFGAVVNEATKSVSTMYGTAKWIIDGAEVSQPILDAMMTSMRTQTRAEAPAFESFQFPTSDIHTLPPKGVAKTGTWRLQPPPPPLAVPPGTLVQQIVERGLNSTNVLFEREQVRRAMRLLPGSDTLSVFRVLRSSWLPLWRMLIERLSAMDKRVERTLVQVNAQANLKTPLYRQYIQASQQLVTKDMVEVYHALNALIAAWRQYQAREIERGFKPPSTLRKLVPTTDPTARIQQAYVRYKKAWAAFQKQRPVPEKRAAELVRLFDTKV